MQWSGWVLVGLGALAFLFTFGGTVAGVLIWLTNRFREQDEDRAEQFAALPAEFERTRHTMYGALGVSKTELKEFIENSEHRLESKIVEIKDEFKEFRGEFKKLEERVRQIEMIRLAEKAGNHRL